MDRWASQLGVCKVLMTRVMSRMMTRWIMRDLRSSSLKPSKPGRWFWKLFLWTSCQLCLPTIPYGQRANLGRTAANQVP